MTAATDPVTLALTGMLPFMLIVAAALALIVSLGLLWSYKRAVLKSMRARGGRGGAAPEAHTGPFAAPPPDAPLEIAIAQRTAARPLLLQYAALHIFGRRGTPASIDLRQSR